MIRVMASARSGGKTQMSTAEESEISKRYFESFADDYHSAFEGGGKAPLHALINSLFRRKTFTLRTDIVRGWLREFGVAGKHVLDLGCGSGEVSLEAAKLGATVTGIDIVPAMIEIARRQAAAAGFERTTSYSVGNVAGGDLPRADIVMMIGVIEYYADLEALLQRVAAAAAERIVIVDTRGPWWRRQLRFGLARLKKFHLYYHPPQHVASILAQAGFRETHRIAGHSFTAFAFAR